MSLAPSSHNGNSYSEVLKSGHDQQLSSLATAIASVLQSALAMSGLSMAHYAC